MLRFLKRLETQSKQKEFLLFFFLLFACFASGKAFNSSCEVNAVSDPLFSLMILVDAPHFDDTDGKSFLRSLAKTSNNGVGHAWIVLKGIINEQKVMIEGGHSGERGLHQRTYFEDLADRIECQWEANPAQAFFEAQKDGFFQKGSGGHHPTYGIKIPLIEEQFFAILNFIHPKHYDYANYSITANQCSSFVMRIAQIAGLHLECEVTLCIPQKIRSGEKKIVLWRDPAYSHLTFYSPDKLEASMRKAVASGCAIEVCKFDFDNF